MSKMIKIGYEIGTGKEINISPSHLMVTGLSQKAGKTTALESFIKSSNAKAIVFRTKVGEKSFLDGTQIPPYFKEKSDWQYIESLIEATMKEKVGKLDRAIIIKLSKKTNGKSLLDFKKVVDNRLEEKIGTFESMLLTNLQAYLEIVLPKLQTINFSNTLELVDGLNIINLERFSRDTEVQSLIIASVLEEVLHNHKGVTIIIPEAWKFIPQQRGSPCKNIVEEFIRQGATNKNYLWIDSQDMTGVDKIPLKQISEWILGYQSEKNEVKHTLDQIPLPKASKPKEDEIMQLGTGIFFYASRDLSTKVYVQPFWLDDETAIKIAKGEMDITEIDAPKSIAHTTIKLQVEQPQHPEGTQLNELKQMVNKELTEMRTDFFNKIEDLQDQINKTFIDISGLKTANTEVDIEFITKLVMQKMPQRGSNGVDIEAIINQIIPRLPKSTAGTVYEVAPLEKIQKDFLEECKQKILADVTALSPEAKKILKYLESQKRNSKVNELVTKCFLEKSGTINKSVGTHATSLAAAELCRKDSSGRFFPELKKRITFLLGNHAATEAEIENLYQHILMELLN